VKVRSSLSVAANSMASRHYLKPDEAGAMIAVSPKTLANWRVSGYGPPWYRVGGAVRYSPTDLVTWVKSQERKPNANSNTERKTGVAIRNQRTRVQSHNRLGRHRTQQDQSATVGG
jgi:hypothetical protein